MMENKGGIFATNAKKNLRSGGSSNTAYDWDWIRSYYIRSAHGELKKSLKDIAAEFEVPYQTVRRKAASECWNNTTSQACNLIEFFPNKYIQQRFLELAKPLAHRDYERLEEMAIFDDST